MDDVHEDKDFMSRRGSAVERLDAVTGTKGGDPADRKAWFEEVYRSANDDPAAVPWADLAPKETLLEWLAEHPGQGRRAVDIACGLGDNAQALAEAGWRTSAFDFAPDAISWAKRRFPDTSVDYQVGDLFALPPHWRDAFDLVHECYTLQALNGDMRAASFAAVTGLVKPGGRLLVITRVRPDETKADGPPWPLTPKELANFTELGLEEDSSLFYDVRRPDGRVIPHLRIVYRKPA
ncbi:class I SAM-dependent methyltransferase [Breoghania sp.]|uniref:class I SAM-dependent methyltransferase n=1 Tax=Breoghania sp. TaxID=2065378 RepID=UPI002AA864C7|nr:class I SAM-dependent methyltransferase [Breoghania sp.]